MIAPQDDKEPRIMPKALVPLFFRKWINVAQFKTKSLRINLFIIWLTFHYDAKLL